MLAELIPMGVTMAQSADHLTAPMSIVPGFDEGGPICVDVMDPQVATSTMALSDSSVIIPSSCAEARSQHIMLTSVSSDSHTWNLVFLQLLLEYMGHRVTNLGACTPDDDVVEACRRLAPDLLVVSTVNGHGNIDGERLIGRIRDDPDLSHMPAVIGGKLGVRGTEDYAALAERLLFAGYSAVFDASTLPAFEKFVRQISMNTSSHHLQEIGS